MRVDFIPFRAKHLFEIDASVTEEMFQMGQLAAVNGTAYTLVLCGDPIGAGGVLLLGNGRGEAWSLLNPIAKRFPFALHKAVKTRIPAIMRRHKLRRVHATVDARDFAAVRWVEALGFEYEGLMKQCGNSGEDLALYAMIAKED